MIKFKVGCGREVLRSGVGRWSRGNECVCVEGRREGKDVHYVCMYVFTLYVRVYTHICVYTCVRAYVCVCGRARVCICENVNK